MFLLAALGAGAIFGGAVLIISPSGKLFGMPLYLLKNSPFLDFLLPGLILFLLLGLAPGLLVIALLRKTESAFAEKFNMFSDMRWQWGYTIYMASILIVWIQAEMFFMQAVHWSHALYMVWAMAIIYMALLPQIRNLYRLKHS
ncbi:hypothetical protein ACFSYC_17360 [Mucilaginibacter antarcticus]|uniref:Uncharacterized protein n=2 Tax=Mucilaginibacter antarcticus TaxID=1855725 RepID=A0ABW5XSZ3_9SPHI